MYFPGDPLFRFDPIFHSIRDEQARQRLVAAFELEVTQPEWALGFQVRHRARRPRGDAARGAARWPRLALTPSQTTGPFLTIGLLGGPIANQLVDASDARAISIRGVVRDGAGGRSRTA